MKKYIIVIAALAALVSCRSLKDEWDPVFTLKQPDAAYNLPVTEEQLKAEHGMKSISTIAEMKKLYDKKPVLIKDSIWIKGQVISSDESGNIYSELYIQDATGAINLKLGQSSIHNEYPLGTWVYVMCKNLTLGAYNGMPQLGMGADETLTNEYETSYIGLQSVVESHVFRGFQDTPVKPAVLKEIDIKVAVQKGFHGDIWGKLVTLKGLTYGHTFGMPAIYALIYPNPNLPHKSENPENRIFLSTPQKATDVIEGFDYTWGVNTWGCSKADYINYINSGVWDKAEVDSGNKFVASYITRTPYSILNGTPYEQAIDNFGMDAFIPYKEIMIKNASANYISHFFTMGETNIQVRTSGYAKFAGQKLDQKILDKAPVSITGIISIYTGSTPTGVQITLIDEPSISVVIE